MFATRRIALVALAAAALVSAAWGVWWQTGGFEYVRLDDNDYTFDCPFVVGGVSGENIETALTTFTHGGIWMPVTSVTYMLDISLFGAGVGNPRPHHLASVGWHGVNAVLFFLLLLRLFGGGDEGGARRLAACFLAAMLWAVHPLRNESVAWIASRKDLVFGFWTLLGLHAWMCRRAAGTVCGWLCCALACMSKPTAMAFPFVAFAVEFVQNGGWRGVRWRRYAVPLALAAATGALAVYSQTNAEGNEYVRGLYEGYGSLLWRCLNASVALGLYLAQTVVPAKVHVEYRAMVGSAPQGMWLGLAVLAAVVVSLSVVLWRSRFRLDGRLAPLWAGAFWFVVALAPTLGVAGGFGEHARADRFLYLPAMGLSVAVAWALCAVPARQFRRAAVLVAICAAVYACAAHENAKTYATDYALFRQVLDDDPDHPLALAHVGTELCARLGRPDEGIECYRRALRAERPSEDTAAQLAFSLSVRGRREDFAEIKELCANLVENPALDEKGMASEALGKAFLREGNWEKAAKCFAASADAPRRRSPPDEALIQLAICRYRLGDKAGAEKILKPLAMHSANAKVKERSRIMMQALWRERNGGDE